MEQPGESHPPEPGGSARHAQDALDRFRLLYGALAAVFLGLLVVPIVASTSTMVAGLLATGGGVLFLVLQVLLFVLLVMAATVGPRHVALPTAIAGVSAGWLLLLAITIVATHAPRLYGSRLLVVALMVGTTGLAATHAVLERRRARAEQS